MFPDIKLLKMSFVLVHMFLCLFDIKSLMKNVNPKGIIKTKLARIYLLFIGKYSIIEDTSSYGDLLHHTVIIQHFTVLYGILHYYAYTLASLTLFAMGGPPRPPYT